MERAVDGVTGARHNPLRNLGALGFYFFWIVTASGVYLYAFFDTSVTGAWQSVERITHEQWYLGGLMRSLHRYASAGFCVVMLVHLLKETLSRHFGGLRTFSWLTGVPLIWLAYAAAIGGYWLVWDRLAQFSATATMEWLDALGIFGEPLARNFIAPDAVDDRLFSLLVFLHIGIPLALLLGMWTHIQRLSHAAVLPSRRLAACSFAALLAVSVVHPALSQPPADLARVPRQLGLDWFYMFVHPLMYETSAATVWWLAGAATLLLAALPLFVREPRAPAAVVDPRNCNGCGRCVDDCPYVAITLVPHSITGGRTLQALVDPDRCAACGICVGACPSSTPFRSARVLASGIELPQLTVDSLRARLRAALAPAPDRARYVVFGCDCAAEVASLASRDVAVFGLPCAGMLPPSFIAYALRLGAQGVVVSTCGEGECAYRLGAEWIEQRISARRDPRLRRSVPRDRVRLVPAAGGESRRVATELALLRAHAGQPQRLARRGEAA
ncbi:MAG TPA: hydrogenase iron-sulfur subunit [Burkholderiales bacterium]|nr:hydrogenase iron-sulfur subunit [Burkholderiales bacterium]